MSPSKYSEEKRNAVADKIPQTDLVVIGGSAGCVPVIIDLLDALPPSFPFAVVLVIHRQKSVPSEMDKVLGSNSHVRVIEPNDKDFILPGRVYLAPQNYHLLIEQDRSFSLDYSEPIHYSRPSIDPTFESAADVFGRRCTGILLSGANRDGADGLASILQSGGTAIVQDPATCDFPAMPQAGLEAAPEALILAPAEIASFISPEKP